MIDPLSIGLGLGGLLLQQFNAKKATDAAKQNQAFIQQGLSRADQTSAEQLGSARQQAGGLTDYAQQNYSDLLAQAMAALSGQNAQARLGANQNLSQAGFGAGENLAEARRGAGESLTEARRGAQELRDVGREGGDRIAAAARTSSNIQGRNRPLFDELLQRAADDYRYSQPKSEESRRDELTRLLNMATPQSAQRVDQRGLATITQGAPATTPQERLAQIMLKAREQAGKEFAADQASGSQRRLGAIAQFGQQAQGVGDTEKDYLNALIGNRETSLKTAGAGNQSILAALTGGNQSILNTLTGGNQSILAALAGGNQSILDALIKGNQGVSGAIQSGGQSTLGAMGTGNKAIQEAIGNKFNFADSALKGINTAASNVTNASSLAKPDLTGTAALMRGISGTTGRAGSTNADGGFNLGSLFGGGTQGTVGSTTGATTGGGVGPKVAVGGATMEAPFTDLDTQPWWAQDTTYQPLRAPASAAAPYDPFGPSSPYRFMF